MNTKKVRKMISHLQQMVYADYIMAVYGGKIYITSYTAKRLQRGNKRTSSMVALFLANHPNAQLIVEDEYFNRIWE